mgnify:CR=1 FL=1
MSISPRRRIHIAVKQAGVNKSSQPESEEEPAGIKGHMQLVGEKVVSKSECNQNESSQTDTK